MSEDFCFPSIHACMSLQLKLSGVSNFSLLSRVARDTNIIPKPTGSGPEQRRDPPLEASRAMYRNLARLG